VREGGDLFAFPHLKPPWEERGAFGKLFHFQITRAFVDFASPGFQHVFGSSSRREPFGNGIILRPDQRNRED
jgi:hypothetical protein